ncbi:MAG: hypothetical protein COY58_07040 [Gammaproteobacteria bacterium CG_4_10_14_0_8_um_filter_38_16]|nr:MAG: hypothetical protein COY58_07040 [Gammaproteobacteria bacterium CG_4_10_14_0_8_um_filter_38_16]PJA03136.1 MAG: hypothetical protein COX72_06545 [Gammaproteobacteria bacterium CG_4_10_14_0_2_um_filter_38_22]PJB09703.1 MAG: hypothetical protein CO120_08695 [Gammaproteobacteria bacterium CG_4_9_14_3_um_filter_38_9]
MRVNCSDSSFFGSLDYEKFCVSRDAPWWVSLAILSGMLATAALVVCVISKCSSKKPSQPLVASLEAASLTVSLH